jgi:hypothetical protein
MICSAPDNCSRELARARFIRIPCSIVDRSTANADDGHFSRVQFGLSTWYPAVGDDVHVAIHAEFVATATATTPDAASQRLTARARGSR